MTSILQDAVFFGARISAEILNPSIDVGKNTQFLRRKWVKRRYTQKIDRRLLFF